MSSRKASFFAWVQVILTIGAVLLVLMIPIVMYLEHSKPNLLNPGWALYGRVLSIVLFVMLVVGAVVDAMDPRGRGLGEVIQAWRTRHEREGLPIRSAGLFGDVFVVIIMWLFKSITFPWFVMVLPVTRLLGRLPGRERKRTAMRIQYEVDRQRRDLPPSNTKTRLKRALRKRPVEQRDRSWLVYELDHAGQVFYWPGEHSYTLVESNGRLHSFLSVAKLTDYLSSLEPQ